MARLEDLELTDEPLNFTGKIKTARGQLAVFISDLSPKFRRLLVGDALTGWEAIDWHELTEEERGDFDAALERYHQLLARVVKAWKVHRGQQVDVLLDYEQLYTGRLHWLDIEKQQRRGAPTKRLEDREDVKRALLFQNIATGLSQGISLRDEIRRPKSFKSGDEQIRPRLRRLGYTDRQVTAILKNRTLIGAAYAVLAEQCGADPRTVRASVARGRRLLAAGAQ